MNIERNSKALPQNGELTLTDVVLLFRRHALKVLAGGFSGVLVSLLVLALTSPVYQASWQLKMAMFSVNGALNNIEPPDELIYRLRKPAIYSHDLVQLCFPEEGNDSAESLARLLTAKVAKSVPNIVEMSLNAASPERAKECAGGIVKMVQLQQQDLIDTRLKGDQERLVRYQQDLRDEQRTLDKLKGTELGNFGYLARLERLRWLNSRIGELIEEGDLSRRYPTKLTGSIYVNNKPVSPKIGLTLLLGGAIGSFVVLLYILIAIRLKSS